MPLFLRKLGRRGRWIDRSPEAIAELQREAGTGISFWEIADDKSNLDRVVAALAASRGNAEQIDFALLPQSTLAGFGEKLERSNGETKDDGANEVRSEGV